MVVTFTTILNAFVQKGEEWGGWGIVKCEDAYDFGFWNDETFGGK